MCGEAVSSLTRRCNPRGPSPRVRGSLKLSQRRVIGRGSIPACAGKPDPAMRTHQLSRVHPRVCGEALDGNPWFGSGHGPSPRVRGSPGYGLRLDHSYGSIPACAGKPLRTPSGRARWRVHPRVCGEAQQREGSAEIDAGPSPRVRGSLRSGLGVSVVPGSIPACAGKPRDGEIQNLPNRVHPRVCGEALPVRAFGKHGPGPSPRVRGSRLSVGLDVHACGSIPACAGKPRWPPGVGNHPGVHPRVCGEAAGRTGASWWDGGPSPRVRGSPGL